MRAASIWVTCAAALALSACGYQSGSMMPDGVTDVAVELFGTSTRPETRFRFLEVSFTRFLTRELVRRAHVRIRPPEQASVIIRGQFVDMNRMTLVEDRRDQPLESAFVARVRVEVIDRETGEPIMPPFLVSRREARIIPRPESFRETADDVMRELAQDTVNRLQAETFYRTRGPAKPQVAEPGGDR